MSVVNSNPVEDWMNKLTITIPVSPVHGKAFFGKYDFYLHEIVCDNIMMTTFNVALAHNSVVDVNVEGFSLDCIVPNYNISLWKLFMLQGEAVMSIRNGVMMERLKLLTYQSLDCSTDFDLRITLSNIKQLPESILTFVVNLLMSMMRHEIDSFVCQFLNQTMLQSVKTSSSLFIPKQNSIKTSNIVIIVISVAIVFVSSVLYVIDRWTKKRPLQENSSYILSARYIIPAVLLLNMLCFVHSNINVGAEITAKVYGLVDITTAPIFEFSLGNTMTLMWQAKAYSLGILICVFSGIWTYLKLILMMICWICPVPYEHCERILIALDSLGKLSMLDSFVLVLFLVAFHFKISLLSVIDVNVLVTPGLGFYTFLLATITSLICTHTLLFYHRKHVTPPNNKNCKISISNCVYGGYVCTLFGKLLVTFLLLVTIVLIIVGIWINSFVFKFEGLASWFLEHSVRTYSWITLLNNIPESVECSTNVGIRWIQFVIYSVTVVIPLLHIGLMLVLWWVPLNKKYLKYLFHVAEVSCSWSSLEVVVISLAAAVFEIEKFTTFIIGDKCDTINKIIGEECFVVVAELKNGFWVMTAACIITIASSQIVLRCCHYVVYEKSNYGVHEKFVSFLKLLSVIQKKVK